jgi:hypothetical protein
VDSWIWPSIKFDETCFRRDRIAGDALAGRALASMVFIIGKHHLL